MKGLGFLFGALVVALCWVLDDVYHEETGEWLKDCSQTEAFENDNAVVLVNACGKATRYSKVISIKYGDVNKKVIRALTKEGFATEVSYAADTTFRDDQMCALKLRGVIRSVIADTFLEDLTDDGVYRSVLNQYQMPDCRLYEFEIEITPGSEERAKHIRQIRNLNEHQ